MSMLARLCGRLVSALVILAAAVWGALALLHGNLLIEALRAPVAGLFGLAGIMAAVVVLFSRRRWKAAGAFAGVFVLLLAGWGTTSRTVLGGRVPV